jgi:GNAT superfamily N-acetyltransferase
MPAYVLNPTLDPAEVALLYAASGINRPWQDLPRMTRMLGEANLVIAAWEDDRLVGLCRALTDYSYCCYLADLAVDRAFQRRGIGRELIAQTRDCLGDAVSIVLMAAPDALGFYPRLGFERIDGAFVLRRAR